MRLCWADEASLLWHGDCREVLPVLGAETLDACVTDPPYGLKFMGRGWDHGVPGVEFWEAVKRVLKPGAHLLAFGGTRTHHRLMCAIEDAGFEIRDTCMWLYGSGFPKSYNVGRSIEKLLTTGKARRPDRDLGIGRRYVGQAPEADAGVGGPILLTTDAARQWEGWGTALKPAWEPIIMARKPLIGTVAANVQEHGTGAINVGGCRLGYLSDADRASATPQGAPTARSGRLAGKAQGGGERAEFERPEQKGRWPANLVLSHTPDCREVGTRKVGDGERKDAVVRHRKGFMLGEHADGPANSPDTYGTETVAAWECVEGCPVQMLDEQSGERPAGTAVRRHVGKSGGNFPFGAANPDMREDVTYGDTGGASRFFYCAKASRRERNYGLDGTRNDHPTVKPVALMRWLVRLVTPPGGTVLDPFMGSGSTKLACVAEDFHFTGIDIEEHYCELARART